MIRQKTVVSRYKATKPLLSQGRVKTGKYYLRAAPESSPLDTDDGPLFMLKKKRKTSLHWIDATIILLEMFQVLALLQVMSLRWVWPKSWLINTNFLFLFNLDIWEFMKVSSGSRYGVQKYYTPSGEIPFSYNFIILGWGILLVGLVGAFMGVLAFLRYKKHPYLLVYLAKMERIAVFIVQVLSLPLGIVMAKLFQCTDNTTVDPLNDVTCFAGIHWAYVVISILIAVPYFFLIPGWWIYRTRQEILANNSPHHETYLQLKEMEYMSGLDVIWMVKGFHIFSSFNLRAVYFRPYVHIFKLVLLTVYAAGAQHIFAQSLSSTGVIFIFWLSLFFLRPFRITSFNVMLIFGYLCLVGDCIMGTCLASVLPSEVLSPWLVEPYSKYILVVINCFLFLGMLVFVVHLLVYNCYYHCRKGRSPLWPSMANQGADKLSEETKKYMVAVLKARAVIEKCRSSNPLFSPVHELSHQIQVINAYFREAEKLGDGLHDTLWDILDEMIQLHGRLEPKSLFGDTVKDSIRETAEELMKMMPMFTRRLAQREYDLILVPPIKRRMLLKMLAMGYFLNGRPQRIGKKQILQPEMTRIWPESLKNPGVEDKIEYYEDLMPTLPPGPDQEQMYVSDSLTLSMQIVDLDEDEKSISSILKGAPEIQLLSPVPSRPNSSMSVRSTLTYQGEVNPAFEGDEGHQSPRTDTIIDLEDYTPGETTTDDLPGKGDHKPGKQARDRSPSKSSYTTQSDDLDRPGQKEGTGAKPKRNKGRGSLKRTVSSTHIDDPGTESEDSSSQPTGESSTSQSKTNKSSSSSTPVTTSSSQPSQTKQKKKLKKRKSGKKQTKN